MDIQKEYTGLMEAFNSVYENQEQLDEGRNTSLQALAREKHNKENPKGKFDKDKSLAMGHNSPSAYNYEKDPQTGSWSNVGRRDGATTDELRTKVSQRSLRNRRGNVDAVPKKNGRPMFESAEDLFDYLLEYLVAEGYADTNKAALAIMANMSEEWKQSIVEGGINFFVPSRIDDFNNRRDELKNRYKQDVGPRIPGPGGGGQYGEPSAPKATGVRLARGTSSSNRGTETKNNA